MRKLALAGIAACLAACGGSNGSNNNNNGTPGLKTFSYGTPQAPTTRQQNAANTAQAQLGQAVNASLNGQAASAASMPFLTDSLAGALPASLVSMPADADLTSGTHSELLAMAHSGSLSQGCYSVSNSTITYNNCTVSGSGFSETINGTETVSGSSISWNLTVTWNYNASGTSENGTYSWTGQVTVTSSTIVGQGRSSFSGHLVSAGTTYDFQYTTGFDANLNFQTSPSFCLTSGTLEIRRTLNSSTNSGATGIHDAGAKYTWSGCGSVTVATGS